MNNLTRKINNNSARIGIIGLGYIGVPLALTFAKKFHVIGYDISKEIISSLLNGKSHIRDVNDETLQKYLNRTFFPTTIDTNLKDCDFIIICVPTPLTEKKDPDLSYIKNACKTITKVLKKGQFIILESTTYPGTTEEIVIPILEHTGLTAGSDFGVAYSPERVDPGNKRFTIENTPKIVGGINEKCTEIAAALYGDVIKAEIIKVKDCKTAEATKIVENIFRGVNIALVNELALIFEKMGIDVWEVEKAASTKPFGFMPFYPGPGIGGHCIPLDPYYLSYKAKKFGFIPRFIELSGEINEFMKMHTVNLVAEGLKRIGKNISNSKIAILGLAYKKDIDDTRETPSRKIIEEIIDLGGKIRVYDPYIESIETTHGSISSEENIEKALKGADCAVFVVDHNEFKKLNLKKLDERLVIIDCKEVFDAEKMQNFVYFCIGKLAPPFSQ